MDKILLLGDPRLRQVSEPVLDFGSREFREASRRLMSALDSFRREYGFGRAISAPQIGILMRLIAMDLGRGPFLIANPELTRLGEEKFTMWDDCMSFPWLMVRLERRRSVDLRFRDEKGGTRTWLDAERSVSELLQHEIDHLDGILAIDRALDRDAIVAREVYLEHRRAFDRMVDYSITPTI